jgi:hypothetical protein
MRTISTRSRSIRKPLGVVALLAVAALSAGCGTSTGGGSATGTPTPAQSQSSAAASQTSATASTAATTGAPGSGGTVLGGPALQTKLGAVPLPAGYTVVSSSQEASSGAPTSPDVSDGGITLQDCSDLTNADSTTLTTDYEASYATYQIQNSETTVTVAVADYYPGDVQQQMSEVSTLAGKCTSYQATAVGGGNVTLHASTSAPSGLGDQSLDIHLGASTSGYVADEFLLVRSGDQIVAMDDSNAGGSMVTLTSLVKPYLSALT